MHIYLRLLDKHLDMKLKQSKTVNGDYSDIAARMRDIRLDARLTQKEMAKLVGMTAGSVGALENGLYSPNYEVLRALKKKLGVSYDYVIDGVKNGINHNQLIAENKELKAEVERLRKMIDKLLK